MPSGALRALRPIILASSSPRRRELLGSLRYTTDEMSRPASGLSGGQRAKLLLASLALSGANVLILDEPTRNLSPLSGPALRRALRAFPGAIISVSHDRKFIFEVWKIIP